MAYLDKLVFEFNNSEKCKIYPSMIGFDHDEFRNMVRDELTYYGFERKELAIILSCTQNHIDSLMDKGMQFTFQEIKILIKRFNFYEP
jgi:hypothetical protein